MPTWNPKLKNHCFMDGNGETTLKIWSHPTETTIKKWMAFGYQVGVKALETPKVLAKSLFRSQVSPKKWKERLRICFELKPSDPWLAKKNIFPCTHIQCNSSLL